MVPLPSFEFTLGLISPLTSPTRLGFDLNSAIFVVVKDVLTS